MFRNICLVSIFLASGMASAVAQSLAVQPLLPDVPGTMGKTNALQSRLVGISTYMYAASSGYVFNDSVSYIYSNGRGGDATAMPKFDTCNFIIPGGRPVGLRHTAIYNNVDSLQTLTIAPFNQTTGEFIEQIKMDYYYDASHFRITDTTFGWAQAYNKWVPTSATLYVNNTNGKPLKATQYNYESSAGKWIRTAVAKTENVYDANDKLTERTFLVNTAGTLQNYTHDIYSYNANGKNTAYVRQEWNSNNTWVNATELYYTLNANGYVEKELALLLNRSKNTLDTIACVLNSFDANDNITTIIRQSYDYDLHTMVNALRIAQTYNSYNQLVSFTTYYWNANGTWETSDGNVQYHYYYENYFPTDVAQLPQKGGTLQVYPVPANNTLNISINWDVAQAYTLTIADMQGRVNMQYNSKATTQTIDVSMLPAGTYNLILKGDKGGVQHSKFTVVR